jgi:alkaline phosphatase
MVEKGGPRRPIVSVTPANDEFISNPKDNPDGFAVSGNLNLRTGQGVHSLTDVPVFALGPCSNIFGGVYNNVDIFFKISECLGLSGYGL